MRKLLTLLLLALATIGLLAGCGGMGRGHGPVDSFQFLTSKNPGLKQNVTGAMNERPDPVEITMVVPPGTDMRNLVASFALNAEVAISVVSGGAPVAQQNGVTVNDFSAPVLYSILVPKEKKPWRYRVSVREAETDASLAQITIGDSSGLSPSFSPRTKSYSAVVPFAAKQVKVDARAQSQYLAGMTIDGMQSKGTAGSTSVDFSTGNSRDVVIETLAEDGVSRDQYTVTIKRAEPERVSTLDSLEITGSPLSPSFSSSRLSYKTVVPFESKQFIVRVKLTGRFASAAVSHLVGSSKSDITYKGKVTESSGATIDFADGSSYPVAVTITAQDGSQRDYVVEVVRAEPDHNNYLASLGVPDGKLLTAFTTQGLSYAAEVPFLATQVTITALAQSKVASITLEPGPFMSSTEAANFLYKGDPTAKGGAIVDFTGKDTVSVAVAVTAQDGKTLRYAVNVKRGEPDHNNALADLALVGMPFAAPFSPQGLAYQAQVPFGTKSVAVTAKIQSPVATMTLEPGPFMTSGEAASFAFKGNLTDKTGALVDFVGKDRLSLAVAVTAQDGKTQRYALDIRRGLPDSNADLNSIAVSAGVLSPLFTPRVVSYVVSLAAAQEGVELTVNATSAVATIAVAEQPNLKPAAALKIPVAVAAGKVEEVNLTVTAEDGTQRLYRIRVSREAAPVSAKDNNARVGVLAINGKVLSPAFDPAVISYDVRLNANESAAVLNIRTESAVATMKVDGQPYDGRNPIQLAVDAGTTRAVTIDVTSESGAVMRYTIRITRDASTSVKPPASGSDQVAVSIRNLKVEQREADALASKGEQPGSQAQVTVRYYRSNQVIMQQAAPVSVKATGKTWMVAMDWVSPGVALDHSRMVEVEVAIPTNGRGLLYYVQAQQGAQGVTLDVPFLLYGDSSRVNWPGIGRPVSVVGYVSDLPRGQERPARASDKEDFDKNGKGEFGITVEFYDAGSGALLAREQVTTKPGLPRSHVFAFGQPVQLPEGAQVRYVLTAKAKNGKAWTAKGTDEVWTTNIAYAGGFEPVVLTIADDLQ